ncbi:uncharacterized protein [Diadema setosum]|uniref:uncharacterized protein n=1 Tax=Diadema setosum TaxID=31175 RepID=UPI003B3A1E1C
MQMMGSDSKVSRRSFGYGSIYTLPMKLKMCVACFEGIPSVKLIDGPSPLEGIVVLSPDRYVCYDGFNNEAAELICGELGFPAAEEYSPQIPPSITTWNRRQRTSCLDGYIRLEECLSHRNDCPRILTVRLKCRDSHGFCDYPGDVSNGYWDSNITSFGSEMTLTCGQGFILTGNPTLQCGRSGWSTYFPVWNASVPSCRAVKNKTSDKDFQDVENHTTTTPNTNNDTSEIQLTQEFSSKGIIATSTSGLETDVTTYTMATLLCVVLILLSILSMAWCKQHKKRGRPTEASNPSNENPNDRQVQMYPVDTSTENPRTTEHVLLESARTDIGAHGHHLPNHPVALLETTIAQQQDPDHIYQDAAEVNQGYCQPSGIEQTSSCTVPGKSNGKATVSAPTILRGVESVNPQTSFDQTESSYEDCEDFHRSHMMKKSAFRPHDEAFLFDDTCYNSLTRFDDICTGRQDPSSSKMHPTQERNVNESDGNREQSSEYSDLCKSGELTKSVGKLICGDNEYDQINPTSNDNRARSLNPAFTSTGPVVNHKDCSHQTDDTPYSNLGSLSAVPSDEVFYFQLHPAAGNETDTSKKPQYSDAFDSTDYTLLNPEENSSNISPEMDRFKGHHHTMDQTCSASKPENCEELYAKVNKVSGPSPEKAVMFEELYATVDKRPKSCIPDTTGTLHEELYINYINT